MAKQRWQRNLSTLKRKDKMDLEAAYKREVGRTLGLQNTQEKKGILVVAGLKIAALHVSALNIGS